MSQNVKSFYVFNVISRNSKVVVGVFFKSSTNFFIFIYKMHNLPPLLPV